MNNNSSFLKVLSFLLLIGGLAYEVHSQTNISGTIKEQKTGTPMAFVHIVLQRAPDSTFVTGTVTGNNGIFMIPNIKEGNYRLEIKSIGMKPQWISVMAGHLSNHIDIGTISLEEDALTLSTVTVSGSREQIAETMEKKVFTVSDNIAQSGGSLLQVIQNLPGVKIGRAHV